MKGLPDELLKAAQAREGSTGAEGLRLWWGGVGEPGWEQFSSDSSCIDLHGVCFFRYVFQANPDLGQVVHTSCTAQRMLLEDSASAFLPQRLHLSALFPCPLAPRFRLETVITGPSFAIHPVSSSVPGHTGLAQGLGKSHLLPIVHS